MELTTITQVFLERVKDYPDNTLFHYSPDGWKAISYNEFFGDVISLASYLILSGAQENSKIGICSENRPEWCAAYMAVMMAGAIAVPIDPQSGPEQIKNLVSDSESGIIFFSGKTSLNVIAGLKQISGQERSRITLINFDSPQYKEALRTKKTSAFPPNVPDNLASIIYTSGTTGNPKGVMLTHQNFCSDANALIDARIVSHEDNVLSVLPLHHTYAFMCTFLVPLFLGASITFPPTLKGPDLISAVRDRGVSIVIGVPQLLNMIRNGIMEKISGFPKPLSFILLKALKISGFLRRKLDINIGRHVFRSAHIAFGKQFRFFASGGARLDPVIMEDLEALGFTVLEGYGLTESSPVITFNPPSRRIPGSAGRPLPSAEIKIMGPPDRVEGEIAVKGPMVMSGYYKNPAATSDVLSDGWLKTGDIGKTDSEGYLFITGRSKEVIVLSSGKNIYPEDVEKIYLTSPLIKEICVVGADRQGAGEALRAIIVPDFEFARTERIPNIKEALKQEINDISIKLPSYMRLTGFSVRKEPFPRTPLGKLRRFLIKEEAGRPEKEKAEESRGISETADETAKGIARILEQFTAEKKTVRPDDDLELDIGLDSLSKIELVVALEQHFSLKLPEDFLSGIQNVRELTEKIRGQGQTGAQTAAVKTGWKEILSLGPSEEDLRAVSLEDKESRMIPTFLLHTFLKIVFKLIFRLEARGTGNIPLNRNFILASNHTSYLDGPAVILSLPFSYFRNIYSLGLSEYFTGFLRSGFSRLAHVIPIDSFLYLSKALQISAFVLRQDRSLSIFPEGSRSSNGELMEFKKGIGILAIEMGIPVVPVMIQGAFEAMPRGSVLPRFKKITVTFGKPLIASEVLSGKKEPGDDYQFFADVLREKVLELKTG